ncbi:phenylalanine--tRNA ligase subunit beta [Candidatus Pacearchaeota archaeon]|nr:phenylalanine--tRNA ligase subunit beta [Candidatus Pacearchaeota archaeon]|tara:strand:- start:3349 stop:4986 length:1638 start_codon:yes stop_codon:yes gene_type:complete
MANVKFPRKEFESSLGSKITKEMESLIPLFGTPLESLSDSEIELEIFPNRPDLLSMQGFLRAFKAFIGKSPGLKGYKINPPEKKYKVTISPSVKPVRPFTACAIVKNLKFNDESIKEIVDLQEKLHSTVGRNRKKLAIGIYPLEKIKLPIKYLALPPSKIHFIPLESERELSGQQILQKHPAGREYAHLLEDKDKYPVFVDANNKILSMPPIINSHDTGKITESTDSVFIECSGWDQQVLQKTLNIIVTTLSDLGGKVYSMNLHYGSKKLVTPDLSTEKIKISLPDINKLLGLDLKESDLSKLLPKMGYDYKNSIVQIPAWRTDILHPVDITEDIAIAYGYDNLVPSIPNVATVASESQQSKIESKIREILIGLELIEISSYHLIKASESRLYKLKSVIALEDSKTEYKILRPNLLIPALRILAENKDNEYPQNIFELGTIFSHDEKTETGLSESTNLLIASSPSNFTDLKKILDYFASSLSIKLEIKESEHQSLIPGRTASVLLNNKPIGYIGEVHPHTLNQWNVKMPLSVLEISLEEIFNLLE